MSRRVRSATAFSPLALRLGWRLVAVLVLLAVLVHQTAARLAFLCGVEGWAVLVIGVLAAAAFVPPIFQFVGSALCCEVCER